VRGQASPALTQVVAAWLVWQWGRTLSGKTFEVQDPAALRFRQIISQSRGHLEAYNRLTLEFKPISDVVSVHPRWGEDLCKAFMDIAGMSRSIA